MDILRLHQHFLPEDLEQASKQYWCLIDLLTVITKEIQRGDIVAAKYRSTDLTRSLHELSKLADKKQVVDRHNALVQQMIHDGVHIQVIRRLHHER